MTLPIGVALLGCSEPSSVRPEPVVPLDLPIFTLDEGWIDVISPGGDDPPEELPDEEDRPPPPTSCDFEYDGWFANAKAARPAQRPTPIPSDTGGVDGVAHLEPEPEYLWRYKSADGPVMPGYSDSMPLFSRAMDWDGERCFETPNGAIWYDEAEAYALYTDIAEMTTGVPIDDRDSVRTIIGLRGAYPGTFSWHDNPPDRFDDTLVVLWLEAGTPHVREFPVNTDTGDYEHGWHNSSSLRPNRHYAYKHGWHGSYNAMSMEDWGYLVWDDANKNGHWDSDRNGWLSGGEEDAERAGYGHNIHAASVDWPLGKARVGPWSGGCQTIAGISNWTMFMDVTWLEEGTPADYFLVDTRDIAPEVWQPCTPDGSHNCPYAIDDLPFVDSGSTATATHREFEEYNCSSANEGGPEVVYVLTTATGGSLSVSVDCDDPHVDVDVHLLDGDDSDACIDRDHWGFQRDIDPGRYWVVVDTWVDGEEELSGDYELTVTLH